MRRASAAPAAFLLALVTAPAAAQVFVNASNGLPAANDWDCNGAPPICRNPLDSGGWVGVDLGDFDGNGRDDVGAVGRLLYGFHVWRSDAAGNWTEASTGLETACHGRSDVEFADFDGDGRLDVGGIGSINGWPLVYRGDGSGTWSPASAGLLSGGGEGFAFGDFDGDGFADLATVGHFSGGAHAFFGDGAGAWAERSTGLPDASGGHKVTTADFDGDGRDEIVDTLAGGLPAPLVDGVHIWRFDTAAAGWSLFAQLYFNQARGVAAADVDADGRPDLVVAAFQDDVGTFGSVHVFLNRDGAGTFVESSSGLPVRDTMYGDVAAADMTGDSKPDLVAADWNGTVRLFVGDGQGGWSEAAGTGLPTGLDAMEGVAVGDMDGDCRLDVAYAAYTCGVQVYRETDPALCPALAEAGPARRVCAGSGVTLDGSASRVCGCAPADRRYRWWAGATLERDWDIDPTLGRQPAATTVYRLEVSCGAPGPCVASDVVRVEVVPDSPPPGLGNVLGLTRGTPPAIDLWWTDLGGGPWGPYQALSLPASLGPPTQSAFDGPLARIEATAPPGTERASDPDGLADPEALVFYRLRATSACSGNPGPA